MKKWIVLLLVSCLILISGCQSFPAIQISQMNASANIILAVPQNQPDLLHEVSRELARRTENFAQNRVNVKIVQSEDIWNTISQGEADVALCENSLLAPYCAPLAQLEYPYYFKSSEYLISAANDQDVLDLLNYRLKELTPMRLRRIAYSGMMDFVTNDVESVRNWRRYRTPLLGAVRDVVVEDEVQAVWNIFFRERKEPMDSIWKGRTQIAEVDLTRDIGEISNEVILLSKHRPKIIDILVNEERLSRLDATHLAALEEAVIYAAGYCKTLADDADKKVQEQIEQKKMDFIALDHTRWYDNAQDIYLSVSKDLDKELFKLIRRKGIDSD